MQNLIALLLAVATIAGLSLGFLLAFNYPMTSDTANAGLFPMEVMHGNFEYVFPANNPYFFTDYVFHLVIQPLTGYSPVALILTGYAMFVLIVLASAALALRLAGRLEALAAAALVANTSFWSLKYVLYPLYHNGTILFILLSILVIYADRPPFRLGFRTRVLIVTLLQFLGVFSDTLMLPVFTLPLIVYSAYRLWKQRHAAEEEKKSNDTEGSPLFWLASTVPALVIFALKTRMGQIWPGGPILEQGADLASPGSLLQHPEMLNVAVDTLIRFSGDIIVAALIVIAIALVILGRKDRFLQAVLVLGGIFMVIGLMSMTVVGNAGRYLTSIIVLALTVAATGTMRRGLYYVPLIIVFAIVLLNIGSNVQLLNQPHPNFLQDQQGMVDYLESKNITHAYSDYWTANINTYVSGGKITVEPVYLQDGLLRFQNTNSAPRWASVWPDGNDTRPVLITRPGDRIYDWAQQVNKDHPPVEAYQVNDCRIYVYNGTLPT
ncbi:MAG: hypothetical protein WBZ29_02390 [Methanocella sp.]